MQERIIRKRELEQITGYEYTTIFRKERLGQFPKRVKLGPRAVGWKLSEVQAWLDGLPLASKADVAA